MKKQTGSFFGLGLMAFLLAVGSASAAESETPQSKIFQPGALKATDSVLRVKVGDQAPDFTLPSVSREKISLSQYRGKKNVVLSFVPAAWTPVCSGQWPGYNIAKNLFDKHDAVLLGVTADNVPTLFAWTKEISVTGEGLWFAVLSDFWPHGAVADRYGVLRGDGVSERALFVIDKSGIIRYIDVHDINERPRLDDLAAELEKLK